MRKTNRRTAWLAGIWIALVLGATTGGRCADSDPALDSVLDLFVQKGFVTQKEVDKIKAEAAAGRTNAVPNASLMRSRWRITEGIKQVELFGDVRARYEDRSVEDPAGNSIDLQRFRYSVRVGLRGHLFDHFYYGLRVDTAANPRSSWVTLGSSSSGSPYQGPYGKSTSGIYIGQAYLGVRPWDWVELTVGKMPNPLYTTPMVWDGDLNPEGAAERFRYTVGQADLFATFGQFLYQDVNPSSASGGLGINGFSGQNSDNVFQFAWQGGLKYHFTTNTTARIAATLYNYTGLQRSSVTSPGALSPYFGDPYIGEGAYLWKGGANSGAAPGYSGYGDSSPPPPPGYQSLGFPMNQVGLNHLLVLEVPFEVDFKVNQLDARVFGDAAYNLEGGQRAKDAAAAYTAVLANNPNSSVKSSPFSPQTHDVKAYQIGFDIAAKGCLGMVNGAASRRNGWEFKTYWQHIEQYALDPNMIDSDFFEGRENMEGIYLAAAYGFSRNIIGTFRYGHAWRINDKLGTGGSNQDIPQMNPINQFELFQVDLTCRF